MILKIPFQISSRLLPALQIGGAWVQLEYSPRDGKGRTIYKWTIDLPDNQTFSGDKLESGMFSSGNLQEGFESLLSFLEAFAEGGENADLFPNGLRKWAKENQDEFSILETELIEQPGLLDE